MKRPTCKEAFNHRDEFEYVGTGVGYHLHHKIHKNEYISAYAWNGLLWYCIDDEFGNIYKVLACAGKDN